jgi:hypothetical protein
MLKPEQCAGFCGVSVRTVCKWIDNGRLRGRRDQRTQQRSVEAADLRAFMEEYGVEVPVELVELCSAQEE